MTRIVRYYQAGIVNAAFGYGLYAALVAIGLNLFVAQLVAHVIGVAFNYLTYRRHAFRDAAPAKARFAASYVVNYFVGLGFLALFAALSPSPYLAGLLAIIATSAINYLLLSRFVFASTRLAD